MTTVLFRYLCALTFVVSAVYGSRILVIVGIGSKSHRSMFNPLIDALAGRGHDVVVVSSYPSEKSVAHVKELGVYMDLAEKMPNVFQKDKGWKYEIERSNIVLEKMPAMHRKLLTSPEIKELFEPGQKFDLVILNGMFNEAWLGFVHKFQVPCIYMSTMIAPMPWVTELLGNPLNTATDPSVFFDYTNRMTFKERVMNTLYTSFFLLFREYFVLPIKQDMINSVFGEDSPSIHEMERHVSLVFSNSHVSIGYPRPNVPSMIDVGGLHCRDPKPLPKDLAEFIDGSAAEHGFIYFSFGSIVNTDDMPPELLQAFVDVFAQLPQRVVWKWNAERIEGLSPNVKLSKWLPQQDILGHPKIRAFITHGGLFSSIEAIYHGVPLVGVPFFADQMLNLQDAVRKGYAVKINPEDLDKESITNALDYVLNDQTFKENVKKRSQLFRDQETKPLDRAVYWVEYLLRHGRAEHLRSAATELSWIQLNLLDVYAFIFTTLTLSVVALYYAVRLVCRLLCCRTGGKKIKSN